MPGLFGFFSGEHAALMASVVAFTAFFLIGRVAQARQPVALAFACSFLTGLVFGYMPARKAAGLDPVVALASE